MDLKCTCCNYRCSLDVLKDCVELRNLPVWTQCFRSASPGHQVRDMYDSPGPVVSGGQELGNCPPTCNNPNFKRSVLPKGRRNYETKDTQILRNSYKSGACFQSLSRPWGQPSLHWNVGHTKKKPTMGPGKQKKQTLPVAAHVLRQEAERFGRLKLVPNFFSPADTKAVAKNWWVSTLEKKHRYAIKMVHQFAYNEEGCCAASRIFERGSEALALFTYFELLSYTGQSFEVTYLKKVGWASFEVHLWPHKWLILIPATPRSLGFVEIKVLLSQRPEPIRTSQISIGGFYRLRRSIPRSHKEWPRSGKIWSSASHPPQRKKKHVYTVIQSYTSILGIQFQYLIDSSRYPFISLDKSTTGTFTL